MEMRLSNSPGSRRSVRIIGGELRSRLIEIIDSEGLRPTPDRVRETLFNWLQHDLAGVRCLDLYAGTGVLGMEALSRGAGHVDLVESNRQVASVLRDNVAKLINNNLGSSNVYNARAEDWLAQQTAGTGKYDLVFLDPPYEAQCLPAISKQLDASRLLTPEALIYLENDQPISMQSLPSHWQCLKDKKAGQIYYYLMQNKAPGIK